MFKWYLSVIPILINIPLISEAQNTVSEEHTSIPDIKNNNYVELDEVVIVGKSEARRQQEQAFAISVADLSKNYNTSVDIGTITNRMAGVKLRVNGGVGSDYNFTLNGFSGRQVKFFMDGLAMDNFGDAFSINNLPANMVERVEVYKGVLPIGLGADALGGAVNVSPARLQITWMFHTPSAHSTHTKPPLTEHILTEKPDSQPASLLSSIIRIIIIRYMYRSLTWKAGRNWAINGLSVSMTDISRWEYD